MGLEGLADELRSAIEAVIINPKNALFDQTIRIITIKNGDGRDVVSVFPDDKYIEFHGPYTQTAPSIEELKPLVALGLSKEYESNLD